MICNIWFDYEV